MTDPELRPRDEIKHRYETLLEKDVPSTPEEDRGVYGLDRDMIKHNERVNVLKWMLDESVSAKRAATALEHCLTTGLGGGEVEAKRGLKLIAKRKELSWALRAEEDGLIDELTPDFIGGRGGYPDP